MAVRVLPVLDLKHGQVVHARGGRRAEYQPLRSVWCNHAREAVAFTKTLRDRLGLVDWYVADLDALEGGQPQQLIIRELADDGFRLWLDAAVQSVRQARRWIDVGVHRVIVASEALLSPAVLPPLITACGPERMVFSLDLVRGRLRARPGVLPEAPLAAVEQVVGHGFRQLLVLDTASVGMKLGPTTGDLCRAIRHRHPQLTLLSGGGVRHTADLTALADAGVDVVLVGTALHASQGLGETILLRSATNPGAGAADLR